MKNRMKQVWKRINSKTADQKGFTLIELAVALAILGILIAIAVPTYLNVRNRSYDSEAKQVLGEIRSMAWSYYLEKDQFPEDLDELGYTPTDQGEDQRWEYALVGNPSNAEITATGLSGQPTNGRCWTMTLNTDGVADLVGPECNH